MKLAINLSEFGIKRIINSDSVSQIDIDKAVMNIITLIVDGEPIKIEFKTAYDMKSLVDLLTNGQIKL